MNDNIQDSTASPVENIETGADDREPDEGIALCLSGGGYRAALFHVGSLWRLYEVGLLGEVQRISSVSGGSITAAVLGLNWSKLSVNTPSVGSFTDHVVKPVRSLADKTIDVSAILWGLFLPGTISGKIQAAYRKHLYGDATLQDLPDHPRFVINATNVQSGALWRFMKPYMRDYRVGEVKDPTVPIAQAVAASSAFPPVLSPLVMEVEEKAYTPGTGKDLQKRPYTTRVVLSDGGVYDNLGLETAYKRYKTILVSDAGGKTQPEQHPKKDWARHSFRVLDLIDNQVRSLRKRQLIGAYERKERSGTYWGIRTDISHYGLSDHLDCPHDQTLKLAATPTRLKRLPAQRQKCLINWGYAVCDAALRRYVDKSLQAPKDFPYPKVRVN